MRTPTKWSTLLAAAGVTTAFTTMLSAETLNFNPAWKFIKDDVEQGQKVDLDDSSWETVSAPHTFNDVDTFDDWSELGHVGERDQWDGRTWYRKHFVAPKEWDGKQIILEFEAIRQLSEVYINGVKLGGSENGFVPFGFNLSKHLKYGENNVVAVMADNSFVRDEEDQGHKWDAYEGGAKLPWNNPHWHPAHGGIYRNVKLHVKDAVHLTLPLYDNLETVGTYTYALDPSREKATIGVEPEVMNSSSESQSLEVISLVFDADGEQVLELKESAKLAAGEKKVIQMRAQLENPRLWEPASPHVYTVKTQLKVDGKVVDENQEPLGVRWMQFNPHTGFYINDRYVKMKGWGQKPTNEWPGLGAAQPDWMHYFTMQLMAEANGNMVRWGHCAGAKASLVASDQLGILTLQVGVDGEQDVEGHPWEVRAAAFRDMIIYFRNHPSIVVWEGGNRRVSRPHVVELTDFIKKYDPHGGRGYGHRSPDTVVGEFSNVSITMEGGGFREGMTPIEGEYNREESPRRVWDRQTPPYENWHAVGSYDLTAEQFALNQCWQWDKVSFRGHGGGANWIFSDSTSGGRVNTEVSRTSGEVDGVRLPKEAYYACRVIFSDEPDMHLLGHWNYPAGTKKTQYVISNAEEVELFLNGKSLGKQKRTVGTDVRNNKHPLIFSWADVPFEKGEVLAVAYIDGKEVCRHEKKSTGDAVALRITPILGPDGFQANGSDVALFDVEAVDKDGKRVLVWNGKVDFELSGPGIWRGGYNSGKIKTINHSYLDLESGINRVAVRSTLEPGEITLKVTTEKGLKAGSVSVKVNDAKVANGISGYMPPLPAAEPTERLAAPPAEDLEMAKRDKPLELAKVDGIVSDLTYTGPSPSGADIVKPMIGQPAFSDYPNPFKVIHPLVAESEQIRLPFHDWDYWAADVVGFVVDKDAWVYVGHVHSLPSPAWLDEFEKLDASLSLNNGKETHELYRKHFKANSEILIPSNLDMNQEQLKKIKQRHMHFRQMMIFVVEDK